MSKRSFYLYSILAFIIVIGGITLYQYFQSDEYNLKCVIASKDGNQYCVRERKKLNAAANLLANVTKNCKDIVEYMNKKYPDDPRVKKLVEGFNPKKINETLPTSTFTAYSENKGEKLAFCLNKKKEDNNSLIDINTLTFVALHELSHIMTTSIGHKQEFWENFKFLLENAKASGIYNPVDYKKKPTDYCGMKIDDNPMYDLV